MKKLVILGILGFSLLWAGKIGLDYCHKKDGTLYCNLTYNGDYDGSMNMSYEENGKYHIWLYPKHGNLINCIYYLSDNSLFCTDGCGTINNVNSIEDAVGKSLLCAYNGHY